MSYEIGDRVYYHENGPSDTGTVTAVDTTVSPVEYVVKWDSDGDEDGYGYDDLRMVN